MHPDLQKRFDGIEERRRALVTRVRALPDDKQGTKPGPNQFSPIEVIAHFALAEDSNNNFMRKTPPSSLRGKKPKVTFIFRHVVRSMQNPAKPLGTPPYMIPKTDVDLNEVDRKWGEAREELRGFLGQVENPSDPLCKFLFFFGLASADDFLTLIESHLTYHEHRFPGA